MEHDNDIDDLFQKSFESFEVPPPEELKKKIDEHLFKKKKRRFLGAWFWICAPLAGTALVALFMLPPKAPSTGTKQKTIRQETKPGTDYGNPESHTSGQAKNGKPDESQLAPVNGEQEKIASQTTTSSKRYVNHTNKTNSGLQKQAARKTKTRRNRKKVDAGSAFALVHPELSGNGETNRPAEDEKEKPSNTGLSTGADSTHVADSTSAAKPVTAHKDDSSENDSLEANYVKAEPGKPKAAQVLSPFLVGVQFGLTKGLNRSPSTVSFTESNPFYVNFDVNYRLRKVGVSTGINYFTTSESVTSNYTSEDSVLVGTSYDYITIDTFEVIQDTNGIDTVYFTITDSIPVNNYEVVTNTITQSSAYRVSYFSLPVMFSYQQRLGGKFYLDLMAGGVISYQKLRFKGTNPANENVTLSELGFRLCVKTNLRYQFSQFGVSLNSNFSYDLKPVQYQQTTRKRQAIDLGVGVWYNF